MKPKNRKAWIEAAELASKNAGVELSWYDDDRKDDAFHDDGTLHVLIHKKRACFSLGQDTPAHKVNRQTKAILESLNMPELYSDRTTTDVNSDEGEHCPHCGRFLWS